MLITATLLVLLPLGAGAWRAGVELKEMSGRADRLVGRATETAALAGTLVEQIPGLERSGKFYAVLGDEELLVSFSERQKRFIDSLDQLVAHAGLPAAGGPAQDLKQRAWVAAAGVAAQEAPEVLEADFAALAAAGRAVAEQAREAVQQEVADLRAESRLARRDLRRLAWLVAPAVLLLGWLLITLVARPLKRLDRVIRSLGAGSLDEPVRVTGPRDLQRLGHRLDWLRQRLREVSDERERFLRHMSHELKTPLANIREGAELLCDGSIGRPSPSQNEVLSIVRENSLHLQQLIENLLGYSAWHGRRTPASEDRFDLADLATEVASRHRLAMAARGIDLTLKLVPLTVTGDRDHFALLVDNLLSNAVKYARDNGHVAVSVSRRGMHARLEVSDDGAGVHEEDRDRIFEPFYQGRARAAGPVRGTGIGLSIVAEVVAAYGGQVELVDRTGPGACFRVTLPAAEVSTRAVA